ncbi:MAG: lipase family protein [Candidatus Hydrogenedentales bacterium]
MSISEFEISALNTETPAVVQAYALAKVAQAVYVDEPAERLPALRQHFPCRRYFRHEHIFGLVAGNDSDVILAFRGTDDRDWIQALAYSQITAGLGRVHSGLWNALAGVWPHILAALYDTDALDKRLWLTGHSLGGGLATLAAFRLEHENFAPTAAYTFGAPRVLDAAAAKGLRTPLYRVVNNEDALPDMPFPGFSAHYFHAGERLFLTATGAVAANRHTAHLARRIDRAFAIGEGPILAGPWHDHQLDQYLAKLRRLAANA